MEVRKGYKQTEVGIIPKDWEVKPVNQISNPVRGGSPRPAGDPRYFNGSYIPWLTVAGLTNIPSSKITVTETETFLTEEGSLHSRTLMAGTLIIANSGATLGIAKILGIKCCANDGIAALLNLNQSVSSEYLVHFINTKTNYLREVVATGNGQPNLNTDLIGNFKIPLPPTLAEQKAIAEALSDADALIEAVEQLLAKKRQVKQGAMSELLTGKRRLSGFSGKWEVKRLGEVCGRVTTGKLDANAMKENGEYRFYTCAREYYQIDTYAFDTEALLVSGNGANVGYIHYYKGKFNAYQRTYVLSDFSVDIFFVKLFMDQYFQKRIKVEVNAGNTPYIKMDTLTEMEIHLPPTLAEQTTIAEILSDMDAEITALEEKLVKARQVKAGMMSELLTGKVRLVTE